MPEFDVLPMRRLADAVMGRLRIVADAGGNPATYGASYEKKVLEVCQDFWDAHFELVFLLSLEERCQSLPADDVATHVALLEKMYVVCWCSLTDTLAVMINRVYELNLPLDGISLGGVLKGAGVPRPRILAVLARHGDALRKDHFTALRTSLLHHAGEDPEMAALRQAWRHETLLFQLMQENAAATNREALKLTSNRMDFPGRVRELVARRVAEHIPHLEATLGALDEIGDILAETIAARPI